MSNYTKKGHKIVHISGTIFECASEHAVLFDAERNACVKAPFLLARMLVHTPCTYAQLVCVLRAWLTAYEDDELLEQVDAVVRKAIEDMPAAPNAPAPSPAQKVAN